MHTDISSNAPQRKLVQEAGFYLQQYTQIRESPKQKKGTTFTLTVKVKIAKTKNTHL